ncbi:MAG: hypothetical protein PVJ86_00085 [Phycisphaerales bacterium]
MVGGCGCGGGRRHRSGAPPPNMVAKPPLFPGELGFILLECTAKRYGNRGQVSCCHYRLAQGQRIYADVRDLSGMDKGAFRKVGDADPAEAGQGPQESAQLDGDSQGS